MNDVSNFQTNHMNAGLSDILDRIRRAVRRFDDENVREVSLVAVSKTFTAEAIVPVLEAGHRRFGENRVQEAKEKWPDLKSAYENVDLHLIGPLQTNKVKEAVALFDVIETVDREKVAQKLSVEMATQNKNLPCFVQVNIGGEEQKAGVAMDDAVAFVDRCLNTHKLNVVGLMCIPPAGEPAGPYFAQLKKLADKIGLTQLSMGMSSDFETAIAMGATQVRVGSALFGSR